MKKQSIILGSLLIASGSVLAGESLLESAAKQTAVQAVNNAAPGAVQTLQTADQAVQNANALKQSVTAAPDAAKEAVKESVNRKIDAAIPAEAKATAETVKTGKKQIGKLKNKVVEAPKAVKEGAKRKATDKALELLR